MPKVVAGYKTQARSRIVDAARAVFRRKGFRRATMDDIAAEIGVSKGALYLYFRTKTQLLIEIQARTRTEVVRQWEGLLDHGDIAEGIVRSMDEIFSGSVDPGVWHELVAEAALDPEVRSALELDHREDMRLMRKFLEQLEERGRIPKVRDVDTVAEIVMMLLQSGVLRVMLRGNPNEARLFLVRSLRFVLGLTEPTRRARTGKRSRPSGNAR
jgi:AcrR family transcriptional regulator